MPPRMLRADALRPTLDGAELCVSSPWIRSMPLTCVGGLEVEIDGERVSAAIPADGWWFLQDPLRVRIPAVGPGAHRVAVRFALTVPYLPGGPDAPLTLPFAEERDGVVVGDDGVRAARSAPRGADPGARARNATSTGGRESPSAPRAAGALPDGWRLAVTSFSWTPEIVRAERDAVEIAAGIVESGVADAIELEAGQTWRGFPAPTDAEADGLRDRLAAAGGSVTILGASLDDWDGPARRRDDDERLAFLLPQLRAAQRVGAEGVRLPLGQAGPALIRRLLPHLDEHDLVLYEEAQGPQDPASPPHDAAFAHIAELGSDRVRVLLDTSMLMPAVPPSHLARLEEGGLDRALVERIGSAWRDADTDRAVRAALADGSVPPELRTHYMDLLVRFGRTRVADLGPILPLVGAVHLKFWDLDDTDGRISEPIRELAGALEAAGFAGTLCSEWGGHAWIDDLTPADATSRHLGLVREAVMARGGR